jgi:Glycosyltransferase family 87
MFIKLPRVPHRNPSVHQSGRSKTILLIAALLCVAGWMGVHFSAAIKATDFPDFYCAARMLPNSHAHQLYDANIQREYQARYAGRIGTLYIHPPFEAAFYLSVAWLPIRSAYLLWFLVNLVLLATATCILSRLVDGPWEWPILTTASLLFVPVILCLQQGQDSLLLLLLLVLGLAALRQGNSFAAGCWLALGLFKFQIVVPLILVLLIVQSGKTRMQLLKGFILVAFGLAAFSVGICGWSVFATYPEFLRRLSSQPFAGINPRAMANFRGLISLLGLNQSALAEATQGALAVAALLLVLGIRERAKMHVRHPSTDRHEAASVYGYAVILALLVSYHLNPHDLSLLLIPMFPIAMRLGSRPINVWRFDEWTAALLLAIVWLPPLHVWALRAGAYAILSLPLFCLLLIDNNIVGRTRMHIS